MSDLGRDLERLVAEIEGHLLGDGFTVKPRVRQYNEGGVQTAELDVEATGPVGSSSIRWVFECRDRPSTGPEGVAWIEQLVGRRGRLGIDQIFAVSTTGFSQEAERFAREEHVQTRTVSSINDLEADFKVKRFAFTY